MNTETMENLYNEIAPRVTSWLVANGTPYHTACDIVQDSFIRVWQKRDSLIEDPASISGLVFTIARHLRIDLARKGKFIVYEDVLRDEPPDSADSPEVTDQVAYIRQRLDQAFQQLPPLLREAYTLFQISQLPIREIARITASSESLVKVRIFRAKQKLQELLMDLHLEE